MSTRACLLVAAGVATVVLGRAPCSGSGGPTPAPNPSPYVSGSITAPYDGQEFWTSQSWATVDVGSTHEVGFTGGGVSTYTVHWYMQDDLDGSYLPNDDVGTGDVTPDETGSWERTADLANTPEVYVGGHNVTPHSRVDVRRAGESSGVTAILEADPVHFTVWRW